MIIVFGSGRVIEYIVVTCYIQKIPVQCHSITGLTAVSLYRTDESVTEKKCLPLVINSENCQDCKLF